MLRKYFRFHSNGYDPLLMKERMIMIQTLCVMAYLQGQLRHWFKELCVGIMYLYLGIWIVSIYTSLVQVS